MKKLGIITILIILISICVNVSASTHIPILLYHDVRTDYPLEMDASAITPDMFEQHIATLLQYGYTPIDFEDIYKASRGKLKLPKKPVAVCFDDGYVGNYVYAYPVLQKYGVKSTIFVVAETVGHVLPTSVHFNWDEAREMAKSGLVSIQSHTFSHDDLTKLDAFSLERELRYSRYLVEKNTGMPCDYVAFPYGYYNQDVFDAAKRAGYKLAAQVKNIGINTLDGVNNSPLVRINVFGSWTGEDVINNILANGV